MRSFRSGLPRVWRLSGFRNLIAEQYGVLDWTRIHAVPFESARLRRAAYAELQRIIREEEPARPSTKLSPLWTTASDVAERRDTNVFTLSRELRGDLDWITLKAIEKDRMRRYASASELAADITRHLSSARSRPREST